MTYVGVMLAHFGPVLKLATTQEASTDKLKLS